MGRTSKRIHAPGRTRIVTQQTGQGKPQGIKYHNAGIYARLSSDQDLKKNGSAEVQIEIAEKYVEEWNQRNKDQIEIIGCYTDLGKTGTNFDRDAFRRLLQDIRLGHINCVIVKDLSRFGRNYLEAGNYIEKIFPFLGVRFIAVTDGYDTGAGGSHTKQMASEIKNLVNDMYAKDFSAKARLSLKQRREEGSYVGGPPPYGYETCQEGRIRKLRPDENTAEVVRAIYQKFAETESYQAVADYLNIRKINPPVIYKKTKETYCPPGTAYKGWNKESVERILKSETYIGALVQGRTSVSARKEENRVHKPKTEWVKRENTHEALISPFYYDRAARIRHRTERRKRSRNHSAAGCPMEENIFAQVLYCGVCGGKMTRHSYVKHYAKGRRERKDSYFCAGSAHAKAEHCPGSNRISKTELTDILAVLFQTEFKIRLKKRKDYTTQGQNLIRQKTRELEQNLKLIKQHTLLLSEEEGENYIAYRSGKLNWEEYAACRLWKDKRLNELEKRKSQYQEAAKNLEQKGEIYLKAVHALVRGENRKEFTKELVEVFTNKIYVYPGRRVEVLFTCSDILPEAVR